MQHKIRTTGLLNFICVSSHSSHHKFKRQGLPALRLLKPYALDVASTQIQAILLHHFGCVCIKWRLESEFLDRVNFRRPESFSASWLTADGRYSACILNELYFLLVCESKMQDWEIVRLNSNKWPSKCMHSCNILLLQWDSKITKVQGDKTHTQSASLFSKVQLPLITFVSKLKYGK